MGLNYEGIRKGYPRLRRRFGKLVGYVQLCRVFTLMAPLLAGIFGVLTPVRDVTYQHLYTAIYVGITLALTQATGQVLNQYADAELDKIIKNYRPIPSGLVSREEALGLSWLLAIFAVGRAFTISIFFGLVVLTLIFFAVFYSLAPFSPRKIHPLANVAWMAFSRGFLPMFAVLSVYGSLDEAVPYAVFTFLWCLSLQGTKDIGDAAGDKNYGIKTIPNTYGLRGFRFYVLITMVVMYGFAALFIRQMLLLLPISVIALIGLGKKVSGLENDVSWVCFYAGVSFIYVLMFIINHVL